MGGEKLYSCRMCGTVLGSPPHGRGKVCKRDIATEVMGITPAWAGKSFRKSLFSSFNGDHPRMGGEK